MEAPDTTAGHPKKGNTLKYFYSEAAHTLYFIEEGQLCGMPQTTKNTFDSEESFVVNTYDASIGQEVASDGTTYAQIWLKASEALES